MRSLAVVFNLFNPAASFFNPVTLLNPFKIFLQLPKVMNFCNTVISRKSIRLFKMTYDCFDCTMPIALSPLSSQFRNKASFLLLRSCDPQNRELKTHGACHVENHCFNTFGAHRTVRMGNPTLSKTFHAHTVKM